MTIRKTTSIKTKSANTNNTSAALANISIPTMAHANTNVHGTTTTPTGGMRIHRLHHGHYAHHNVVIMASPSRRTSLLQRQVARALECIDMDDATPTNPLDKNANEIVESASVGGYMSPSEHIAAKKTPPQTSASSLAALSAPTGAVLQISPNAIKRKRSHSMASSTSSTASSISGSTSVAGSTAATSSLALSSAAASCALVSGLRVDIEAIDSGGLSTNSRVIAKRAMKAGGVTPSKRCHGKDLKKKKQKVDVIERALKKFRTELLTPSSATSQPSSYEFTTVCPRDDDACDDHTATTTASCSTPRHSGAPQHLNQNTSNTNVRIQIGVAAAQGARAYMEDRFHVTAQLFAEHAQRDEIQSHASLLAVYDGHNGALAADYGASRFQELLSQDAFLLELCLRPACEALRDEEMDRVEAILKDAFEVVDDEILELTIGQGKRDGSTVLLGLLIKGKLFVANLGDTRGVLGTRTRSGSTSDDEGDVVRVSVDHKPDLPEETARVEEAGGKVIFSGCWRVAHDEIPLRLAVSRSLGDHPLKANLPLSCSAPLVSVVPDIQVLDVGGSESDCGESGLLVFATDGLWDRLSDEDAIRIARTKIAEFQLEKDAQVRRTQAANAMHSAAIALVETALVKRSMDNITAMVVSFTTEQSLSRRLDAVETLGSEEGEEENEEEEMDDDDL